MLRVGPYPRSVQARIASSHGHLSNQAAARFATELIHPRLAGVLLAHVSAENNDPQLARTVVEGALMRAGWRGWIDVARQEAPGPWLDVEALRGKCGPEQLSLL
jgi:phosphoribosyl 1,2-cyclic phosphodiesterase